MSTWGDAEILAARGPKAALDSSRPYAQLVESEPATTGHPEPVATLFLTNRECPFRCLMCDLWRHTLDVTVPRGAIPAQIDYALERLPPAKHIKLYNSGNFFDPLAIPPADYPEIARRVARFDTVIVENHPRLCGSRVDEFQRLLPSTCRLEIAMGLETIHPEILPQLNKQMTLDDFATAARRLRARDVALRVFLLLRPPWLGDAMRTLDEYEAVEWAVRGVEYAWEQGAGIVAVIPTRGGNGLMERLAADGRFAPPSLAALEATLERTIEKIATKTADQTRATTPEKTAEKTPEKTPEKTRPSLLEQVPGSTSAAPRRRVVVDLWDAPQLAACPLCRSQRIERLQQMNLTQRLAPPVVCTCNPRRLT